MHASFSLSITDIFTLWCVDMVSKLEESHTLNTLIWKPKPVHSSDRIVPDSWNYYDESNLDSPEVIVVVKQDNLKLDWVQPSAMDLLKTLARLQAREWAHPSEICLCLLPLQNLEMCQGRDKKLAWHKPVYLKSRVYKHTNCLWVHKAWQ